MAFFDEPATVALARMAVADATGECVHDAFGPGVLERCDRRQARRRRCQSAALAKQPIELGARQVIAVHADRLDLLERAQIAQRVLARDDEVGALGDGERAAALAEEAPDLARRAAQRLIG